jgi:hypothetical protein
LSQGRFSSFGLAGARQMPAKQLPGLRLSFFLLNF